LTAESSDRLSELAGRWHLDWLALAAALLLVGSIWLANVSYIAWNNDPYYALATGYAVDPADAFLKDFEQGAIANCPRDDARWCPPYQGLIRSDLFFNYPLFSTFGRAIPASSDGPFAAAAIRAALGAATAGFALATLLFVLVAATLTPFLRAALAALVLAAAPVMMLDRAFAFRQPDIVTSITWPRLAIYVLLIAGIVVLASLPAASRAAGRLRARAATVPPMRLLFAGIAIVALLAGARLAFGGQPAIVLLGVAGFVALFAGAIALAGAGRLPGIAIGLALFLMIGPSYFLWPLMPFSPRCNIFLAMAPYLAYLAFRPNGRLVFLLPALAIFHVSVVGLIATALFGVELVTCLVRRGVTRLLVVAGLVALAVRLYTGLAFRGFGAGNDVATVLATLLASDRALPGILYGVAPMVAALAILARGDRRWDAAARMLMLVAIVATASQITPILDLAGFTFFDPGMAASILAPSYLAPAVMLGATLVFLASLVTAAEPAGMAPLGGTRIGILAVSAVVLLAVARVDGRGFLLKDWAQGAARALGELAGGRPDMPPDPLFARLAGNDDRYFLRSALNPMNDPAIYLSLLKYKTRRAAGAFNPARAVIDNVDGTLRENRPPD
jgi:hypothetical protein